MRLRRFTSITLIGIALLAIGFETTSIGRASPSAMQYEYGGLGDPFSSFSDPDMVLPFGITAGPDGAVWFTNWGDHSIGRISISGVVSTYTDARISSPRLGSGGPGRCPLVHQPWQLLDRADQYHRGGQHLHRRHDQRPKYDHGRP